MVSVGAGMVGGGLLGTIVGGLRGCCAGATLLTMLGFVGSFIAIDQLGQKSIAVDNMHMKWDKLETEHKVLQNIAEEKIKMEKCLHFVQAMLRNSEEFPKLSDIQSHMNVTIQVKGIYKKLKHLSLASEGEELVDILQNIIKIFTDENIWKSLTSYTAASNNLLSAWHDVIQYIDDNLTI